MTNYINDEERFELPPTLKNDKKKCNYIVISV